MFDNDRGFKIVARHAGPGLYPLCRHRKSQREAVAYAAGIIQEREVDPVIRGDLLTTLGILVNWRIRGWTCSS